MDFDQGPDSAREKELERLMALYEDSLLRMCFLYLRDQSLAEDALQETFLKAYRSMHTFRGASGEKTWLMRIAINTCKDMRRLSWFRRVDLRTALEDLPEGSYPFTPQDDWLVREIMGLSSRYREVVLLRYYQNMPVAEVAKALGIPASTAYARLKKAQGILKRELERWELCE